MDIDRSKLLRASFFDICMRLQTCERLCDYLISHEVIEDTVRETIVRHETTFMKNYELLRVLETKNNSAYNAFVDGLRDLQETNLLELLNVPL